MEYVTSAKIYAVNFLFNQSYQFTVHCTHVLVQQERLGVLDFQSVLLLGKEMDWPWSNLLEGMAAYKFVVFYFGILTGCYWLSLSQDLVVLLYNKTKA